MYHNATPNQQLLTMLPPRYVSFVLLAAALLAGCAGSKEAAQAPHPLAGAWAYSIDTPQGVYTGTLVFTEADDMLSGTIAASQAPEQTASLEELMFDAEMSKVTFSYDSGEYGIMKVDLTLDGDACAGMMNVTQFGAEVPFKATRKTME
jgi:hypothetical protein